MCSEQSGELIINGYPNLKKIEKKWDSVSKITRLIISDCPNLETINIQNFKNNQELILHNLPNLQKIDCSNNHLTEIKLPLGEKLEYLNLANNDFCGSLEFLQNMSKLRLLNISNTNIDSGLEYLPDSLEYFGCSTKEKESSKCQIIYNLFANEEGEIKTDKHGYIINFPQKLKNYKQWRKLNFSEEEIKRWINSRFRLSDYNFTQEWRGHNFSDKKSKEWIKAGTKPYDCRFVVWLRDIKNLGSEWIANYKEDYQILSERFKKYGLCPECDQPSTGEQWCQDCNNSRLQENFSNWTSRNSQIDQFIQKYQLEATDKDKFLEWIPYEQFTEIEFLAEGGFGKVYKAKWTKGSIHHWDIWKKQWHREKDHYYESKDIQFEWNKKYKNYREIVLKSLNNSSANTEFLQETEKHKIIDDWFNNIVPCYGISQDPQTGNYLMVMQYMPEGNLRHYLSNKNKELTLKDKLNQLFHIAQGLKDIHAKNLVHRDFHSGNILKGIEKTSCLITDLGLCKPVDEISKEEKIFGVMPYVAPEVLRGRSYTQASDIYSFGIIAYEALSGLPPYYDQKHDEFLGMKICQGLRPQFQIKIPLLLEDLIKKCWDADPKQRPKAQELERILRKWKQVLENNQKGEFEHKDGEFVQQLQEAEEYNKNLADEIKYPKYKIHYGANYHSKLLPTKKITQLLSQSQIIDYSNSLQIDFTLRDSQQTQTNWTNIHSSFTDELIQKWQEQSFTYQQCQEWINIGLNPQDADFAYFLKSVKQLTPEDTLNYHNLENLKQEFINYQQNNQQPQIQINLPNK